MLSSTVKESEVSVFAKKADRENGGAAQAIFHLGSRFEWSALCPTGVTPMERIFNTHSVANWMAPRAGVNVVEKQSLSSLSGLVSQMVQPIS